MRLLWKEWDSAFNPVVALVGLAWLLGGVYGLGLMRHALRHPLVLVIAAIPAVLALMGGIVLVRQFQLWSKGRNS